MPLLIYALACAPALPADTSSSPSTTVGDSTPAREGCQDPDHWDLGGNGRYCEGSCGGQGIVCGESMSPPRCMVTAAEGGRTDCDLPAGEDEELCANAIRTTCASLITP